MYRSVRILLVALFGFILISCAAAPVAPTATPAAAAPALAASTPAPALAPPQAASSFDSSRSFKDNEMLAVTIGSRVAGTDGGAKAGDYIAQQFTDAGFTVEKQPFPFKSWEDHGTHVQVTAPETRDIDARPIQYSPAGKVEAEVVAVKGTGTENDFANANVQGRIALVSRGTLTFSDKAKNAANAGAVAALIYNNQPGGFGGSLRDPVTIPAIALTGQDGKTLLDLLAQGVVKIKVDSDTLLAEKTGNNIIGTLRGSSDNVILLGGHYDSVAAGPGANDNGSGTSVLLELARNLGQQQRKNTIVIIAFDAEELGLIGSRYYVDKLPDAERAKIKGMLNFDMLGAGPGPLLLSGDGALGQLGRDIAGQLGITARNFHLGGNAGSDHESFERIGIDTLFFSRDYDLLHTPEDTIDQVKQEFLDEAGRVGLQVVTRLDSE